MNKNERKRTKSQSQKINGQEHVCEKTGIGIALLIKMDLMSRYALRQSQ